MTESLDQPQTPGEVITRYENVLRELIRSVLGSGWSTDTGVDLDKLREKRAYEVGRRRGVAVPDDLLVFTEHLELQKIINKKWQQFSPILGNKKRWDVYADRIAAIRNAPMHGRPLLRFELDLLAGMAGEIGNIVAQHRSAQGPDSNWYPVVESVTDNHGNDVTGGSYRTPTRLTVGETVRFSCVGRDPQDRELRWTCAIVGRPGEQVVVTGSVAELVWVVEERDVSERTQVMIEMSSESQFHRHRTYDAVVFVGYAVNPPD